MQRTIHSNPLHIAEQLRSHLVRAGYYVALHSTSMLIMKNEKIVATIHIYTDACTVKTYSHKLGIMEVANIIKESKLMNLCKRIEIVLLDL
jgi:hypothetical protein